MDIYWIRPCKSCRGNVVLMWHVAGMRQSSSVRGMIHSNVNPMRHGSFTLWFFSDCDYDSSYSSKWVVQDSMKVFTLCGCYNTTRSYTAHCKQKQIAFGNCTVWTGLHRFIPNPEVMPRSHDANFFWLRLRVIFHNRWGCVGFGFIVAIPPCEHLLSIPCNTFAVKQKSQSQSRHVNGALWRE